MENIYFILGVILYLAVVSDIVQTTVSMQGGGWVTSRLSHIIWLIFLRLAKSKGRNKILGHAGYFILISIVGFWVLVIWASFFLLLFSDEASILDSSTRLPASATEKLYYAGFAISTLGVGDYIASSNLWLLLTNIYAFTGLIFLTMSVTYFIPTLSSVVEKRKLALVISSLGNSPEDILLNCWNGKDFSRFSEKVPNLANFIIKHSQHHKIYPVLHFFHSPKENTAVLLQMARLHESLYVLNERVKEEIRPSNFDLALLQVAFDNYFEVITSVFGMDLVKEDPPAITLNKLQKEDLIEGDKNKLWPAKKIQYHRKIFKTLLEYAGWRWEDVYGSLV